VGNKLVFKICLPCSLFINVYDVAGFEIIQWDVILYCVIMVLVVCLLGVLLALATTRQLSRRGAVAQSVFRSNMAIIGLSLASALGGDAAVAMTSVVSAFTVALFNILAVFVLSMFAEGDGKEKQDFRKIILNIVKNPLIIGIVLGMVSLLIRGLQTNLFGKPVFLLKRDLKFVYTVLNNLKSLSSPLALVVMGGQFTFSAVKGMWKEIASGTLGRIILAPLVGIGTAVLLNYLGMFQFDSSVYPALIALFGSPTAVSSAIMAGQMGADEQLATQLVVWTSIGSIFTIFLTVVILMSTGLLIV